MHGFAVFCPYAVPADSVVLPSGLEPVAIADRTIGLLAYVRYEPPSPLTYHEMIWMPALVRSRSGRRGYWVSRMWVDDEAALRGGRELWAIPKTRARFETSAGSVRVHADHHTEIVAEWRRLSPALPLRGQIATLQVDGDRLVRFRAQARAQASLAQLDLRRMSSSDPALESLDRGTPIAGLAAMLSPFESTMMPPQILPV